MHPYPLSLYPTSDTTQQWLESSDAVRDVVIAPPSESTSDSQFAVGQPCGPFAGAVRPNINFPLHNAVSTGYFDLTRNVVNAMKEGDLPIDEENGCGWTPLMLAAGMGNVIPCFIVFGDYHSI